jgi:uncharacterized protein (DUF885 family)
MSRQPTRRATASWRASLLVMAALACVGVAGQTRAAGPHELVRLYQQWRQFEAPQTVRGIPDYGAAAMQRKTEGLAGFRQRLAQLDTAGWSRSERVDYELVKAEMAGLDFNLRVLRPWARDPSFYVSVWSQRTDVPSRDAPASQPEIELYRYRYPLSAADQARLAAQLGMIPTFLERARDNLKDSNARDLWVQGVTSLRNQANVLAQWQQGRLVVSDLEGDRATNLDGASPQLRAAVTAAHGATEDFVRWLQAQAAGKTGASGVGKEHYDWYMKNVQLMPYSWADEVALLRRELERAHASLRLEEHRNRQLPELRPAATPQALDALAAARLDTFVGFLVDKEIIPQKNYLRAALAPQKASFVPLDRRQFFGHVAHREPMLMYAHSYHWIDLARMRDEPHASPIRSNALLSNIWVSKAEGFATGFEELLMHAGLYDDNPRARELVWVMLANRASRGLASLYVQANLWTLDQAGEFQAEWTPRGWAGARDSLTTFEQLLYLRQPGYGTSYISGKLLFDRLLTRYAHEQKRAGADFELKGLMAKFNEAGMIPMTLVEQELLPPKAPPLP